MLNKTQEEALRIILDKYHGNLRYEVSGEYSEFPEYIQVSFGNIMNQLELLGLIARTTRTLSSWSLTLTPDGISYFDDRKRSAEKGSQMFIKLPSNSKLLLDEIMKAENPTNMLCDRFDKCSPKEDDELRGLLNELEDKGYINIPYWGDDMPGDVSINNSARTYDERLSEYERQFVTPIVNHITYNAPIYGGATTGDIINTTINIDNSIHMIQRDIEIKGGEDKDSLYSLLEEAKTLVDEIKETKQIKENPDFFQKITSHTSKHGWFYGAVLGLIGQVALQVISGI